jgi:uncharacterized protein YdcH (DUF465 family)
MYENRIKHLEESHRVLDQKIDTLEKNGLFEDIKMQELKKQRLLLRDELAILRRKQWEHDHETVDFDDER